MDPKAHRDEETEKRIAADASSTVNEPEDRKDYPEGIRLAAITASLAASVFLCALDETIIATAIPRITDDFKALNDVGWYGSAYFMTFAAFQLIFGKLYSFYSIKKVFLASVAIFETGSLICATAPASIAFIVGRACAGLGSAGINAGFIIILAASLPLERRPIFVSSYSGMYAIAAVVAPILGGAFTTNLTWRWCFYVNLPIGGSVFLAISLFFYPPPKPRQSSLSSSSLTIREMLGQMDVMGTAVLVPGVVCLLLVLQWGGFVHPWGSAPIISLLAVFGAAAAGFVALQTWRQDKASIPPRIIKQRSVACSSIYVFCAGGSLNVFQYFLPIWFQAIQGTDALDSGRRILPTTLGTVLFAFVAGFGVAKTGYYTPFMMVGAALLLTGASLSTTLQISAPAAQWVAYQLVFGAGAGLGIQQAHTAAQTVLAATDVPTGAVILIFTQIMGGTIWLSAGQNILTSQLLQGLEEVVPGLNAQMVLDMGATGLRGMVEAQDLDVVLAAYNSALTRVFCCGVGLAAAALVAAGGVEWRSIKQTQTR